MSFESRFDLVPLGSLAQFINGDRGENYPKSTDYVENGIPFLSATDVEEGKIAWDQAKKITPASFSKLRSGQIQREDILLCLRGSLGKLGYVEKDSKGAIASSLVILRANSKGLARYLRFVLGSAQVQSAIKSLDNGSVQGNISATALKCLLVPNPPVGNRSSIIATLESVEGRIDLNGRINQTVEAMARTIFKSWFVDFDPIKAKIAAIQEGRDPLRAAMSTISGKPDAELDALPTEQFEQLADTVALFPDEMEESELGEIPIGWGCGALGDICSFTAGSAFKPEHQGSTEGDYPFIKVSDMNLTGNEVFIQSANNYVSTALQGEMKAKLHLSGATVFAKIGVALISNRRRLLTTPTIIDNNLMSASPVEGKSGQYFLYSMLSTIDFNTLVSGTALPYINVSDLKKIPIVLPPYDAVFAFETTASSIFSMMQNLAAQSSTLAKTRDTLLPKLLSGEVEAPGTVEG